MGIQPVRDVDLIRHAYVAPGSQGRGVGGALLAHLRAPSARRMLVGTWAAADWAIRFYRRHGFELVSPERKTALLGPTGRSRSARSRRRSCWRDHLIGGSLRCCEGIPRAGRSGLPRPGELPARGQDALRSAKRAPQADADAAQHPSGKRTLEGGAEREHARVGTRRAGDLQADRAGRPAVAPHRAARARAGR